MPVSPVTFGATIVIKGPAESMAGIDRRLDEHLDRLPVNHDHLDLTRGIHTKALPEGERAVFINTGDDVNSRGVVSFIQRATNHGLTALFSTETLSTSEQDKLAELFGQGLSLFMPKA